MPFGMSEGEGLQIGDILGIFAEEIVALVAHPSLLQTDVKTREICEGWDSLCHRLFHAYQDVAHAEVI